MTSLNTPLELLAVLEWYVSIGIDEAIGEEPQDYYDLVPHPTTPKSVPSLSRSQPLPTTAPALARPMLPSLDQALQTQLDHSADRASLSHLWQTTLSGLKGVHFLPFPEGEPSIIAVNWAIDYQSEQGLKPLSPPAETLFGKMIASIGCSLDSVSCLSLVPRLSTLPFTVEPSEIAVYKAFITKFITLSPAKTLVFWGGDVCNAFFPRLGSLAKIRHEVRHYADLPAIASFSPDYLLHTPEAKALAWDDLLRLKQLLHNVP